MYWPDSVMPSTACGFEYRVIGPKSYTLEGFALLQTADAGIDTDHKSASNEQHTERHHYQGEDTG